MLTGEEVPAHILHGPLHPRLVLGGPDPRGVGGEPAVLGVIQPARGEPRIHRVRVSDDRRSVVRDQHLEHAAEEHPRGLTPGDERGQRLGEGQPHEHVPRITRGEDQRMHLALPPGDRVGQQAQITEVELALHPRLAVGDPHRGRRCARTRTAPRRTGAASGRAPRPRRSSSTPILTTDRPCLHLLLDLLLAGPQLSPRLPMPARAHRADHLRDLADQLISQLAQPAITGQPRLHRRGLHTGGRSCGPPPPARPPAASLHPKATPAAPHGSQSRQPPGMSSPEPPSRSTWKTPGTGSDQDPQAGAPGGPITGNRVVPSSWQKTPQGGPMLVAGDLQRPCRHKLRI